MRGGGTPGRSLLASGQDGSSDGVPAGERSLPALRGDGPVTPTLEAMGPSPSVGRASRLLTGFTRAVVRGKHKTKCTSVLPPPLPAASLGKEDAGRLERAKLKIHGVLLTYPPPLRQVPAAWSQKSRRFGDDEDSSCRGRRECMHHLFLPSRTCRPTQRRRPKQKAEKDSGRAEPQSRRPCPRSTVWAAKKPDAEQGLGGAEKP